MNSLNASTEVMPSRQPHETLEERLRRLTKQTLSGPDPVNRHGPVDMHPASVNPALEHQAGQPATKNPDDIMRRVMRHALHGK